LDDRAIAIFDSGVGGLTVLREIKKLLPKEKIIYYGDTLHVPYGNKSKQELFKFACNIIDFLINKDIKLIIIACNTCCSVCFKELEEKYFNKIKLINIIDSGVKLIINSLKKYFYNLDYPVIGLLGTELTIDSKVYENKILERESNAFIISQACPKLVPLIENNILDGEEINNILDGYIKNINSHITKNKYRTDYLNLLVLACTHYPFIKKLEQKFFDIKAKTKIINPAIQVALDTKKFLTQNKLLASQNLNSQANLKFYLSSNPKKFMLSCNNYLRDLNLLDLDLDISSFNLKILD
jgi:glutamate racemase